MDDKEENIDSSDFMEVALNEFFVQGLEIDLGCVIWDADFRYEEDESEPWQFYEFGKNDWKKLEIKEIKGKKTSTREAQETENIKTELKKAYMRNAYRVLLTRSRYGMVIGVPEGDKGENPDKTRKPQFYNSTFDYLRSLGLDVID